MLRSHIFFSYGIGIFDGETVVSARYNVKNEFIIKAIIANPESGFDINYGLKQLLYAHADAHTIFD